MINRTVTKDDVGSFLTQLRTIDINSSGSRSSLISAALNLFFLPSTGNKATRILRDNFGDAVSKNEFNPDDLNKLKKFFELSQEIFEGFNIPNENLKMFKSTFGIETKVTPTNSPRPR